MFDPRLCTEEIKIQGVVGEIARALHFRLEVTYMQARLHDDKLDPLYMGGREVPTKHVLAHVDTWADGYTWIKPRIRTMATANDALDVGNFMNELTSYQESL